MTGLFEPWHIVVLLVVIMILFGAKRLPGAADALGKSMHIFKKSVSGLHDDPPAPGATTVTQTTVAPAAALPVPPQPLVTQPPVAGTSSAADPAQQQLQDLQRQLQDLQRQAVQRGESLPAAGVPLAEAQRNQQSF